MKKLLKKILSITLILLTLAFVLKGEALAADVTVGKDEVIEGPYLNTGDNVTISGTINGDAYIAGGLVTIDGIINGDLLVGGGVVTIKGTVSDDVRAGGGMVTIDGKVGKNVTAFGGTITFGSDTDIDGDVVVGGGTVAHMGNIDGQALIYSNEVTLAGRVGKNANTSAEKVIVGKTAIIDGDLTYTSEKEASVSAQAKIVGKVRRIPTAKVIAHVVPTKTKSTLLRFGLLSYFSMLVLGLVILRIAPRQMIAAGKLIGERPWYSLGLGFLALILTPMAIVILMITVIGIPLAAVLGVGYILMIALSSLVSGLFVGQKVFDLAKLKENPYAMLAVGLLLLQLVLTLPVVGFFVRVLSVLAAVGAVLILEREALRKLEARR